MAAVRRREAPKRWQSAEWADMRLSAFLGSLKLADAKLACCARAVRHRERGHGHGRDPELPTDNTN
jgi:hypothetical protein